MDSKTKYRTIKFYKDYFNDFFIKQTEKVKAKIVWTFQLIEEVRFVPETYLKLIVHKEKIYEIRIQMGREIFRLFCFFDGSSLVIMNGFQKKTQRIPQKEIRKAIKIKHEYEAERK